MGAWGVVAFVGLALVVLLLVGAMVPSMSTAVAYVVPMVVIGGLAKALLGGIFR